MYTHKNLTLQIKLTEYLFKINKYDTNYIIAKTMLNKIGEFPEVTIEEIAYHAKTTPSTVTKFCKKIGYNGFTELKYFQEENYPDKKAISFLTNTTNSSPNEYLNTFIDQTKFLLEFLFQSFNEEQVKSISEKLSNSKKVTVLCGLHGFAAANLLSELLRPYNITVYEIDRDSESSIIDDSIKTSDLVFLISLTGNWVNKYLNDHNLINDELVCSKLILITYKNKFNFNSFQTVELEQIPIFFNSNYISSYSIQSFFILLVSHLKQFSQLE